MGYLWPCSSVSVHFGVILVHLFQMDCNSKRCPYSKTDWNLGLRNTSTTCMEHLCATCFVPWVLIYSLHLHYCITFLYMGPSNVKIRITPLSYKATKATCTWLLGMNLISSNLASDHASRPLGLLFLFILCSNFRNRITFPLTVLIMPGDKSMHLWYFGHFFSVTHVQL